jgi:hypothetical protein|tara:strand:+ start:366 stop:575 length:210 start_codon:yes stop_codon:yes gene_type:complete
MKVGEGEEDFERLSPNQYRQFEMWVAKNNKELYEGKIAWETRWAKDQFFYVKLLDESVITFNDIPLDKE